MIRNRERGIADRERGALGKVIEGPDDRDGALDDRELLTARWREAKRRAEKRTLQIDLAGHVELAVAGACGRSVEDDTKNRPLSVSLSTATN